ncbi:MAG: hypothetical protein KZQ77_04200, partial [Candidatus Thiodiazotropha sp. (ex Notomyrtea botanica)]|nr:hypothetical protein [Candidatus Thiodiazotropha sp. (ex Notomyrtea botanica)]
TRQRIESQDLTGWFCDVETPFADGRSDFQEASSDPSSDLLQRVLILSSDSSSTNSAGGSVLSFAEKTLQPVISNTSGQSRKGLIIGSGGCQCQIIQLHLQQISIADL